LHTGRNIELALLASLASTMIARASTSKPGWSSRTWWRRLKT